MTLAPAHIPVLLYFSGLDPHADTGALIPSANWIKCCFSKNFLESF